MPIPVASKFDQMGGQTYKLLDGGDLDATTMDTKNIPISTDKVLLADTVDTNAVKLAAINTLPISALIDANSNELLSSIATPGAVNELTLVNAAPDMSPELRATGGSTNIGIRLIPKGQYGEVVVAPITAASWAKLVLAARRSDGTTIDTYTLVGKHQTGGDAKTWSYYLPDLTETTSSLNLVGEDNPQVLSNKSYQDGHEHTGYVLTSADESGTLEWKPPATAAITILTYIGL